MAIGVVADDALLEPEDVGDAEAFAEFLLDRRAVELRVAVGIEQDRFGREQLATAIHFDGAALKDHVTIEASHAERCGDARGDGVVEIPRWELAAPGVEFPIGHRDFAARVMFYKNRPMVAAPDIVVRMIEQLHAFRHGFRTAAGGDDRCVVFDGRVDAHNFMTRNGGGDLGEFCVDRIAL